ncbi:hypothetical protein ACFW9F_26095, partial [Streptomyces sp. NPDC059506]
MKLFRRTASALAAVILASVGVLAGASSASAAGPANVALGDSDTTRAAAGGDRHSRTRKPRAP